VDNEVGALSALCCLTIYRKVDSMKKLINLNCFCAF
jgi:hypothetical protein